MKTEHGYVINDTPKTGLHSEFQKGLMPAPQIALIDSQDGTIEVGKRTYQLQGDAADIVKFLGDHKELQFTAKTLGDDGEWGVGKDKNNENITIAIGAPGAMKSLGEHLVETTQRGVIELMAKPVLEPMGRVYAMVNPDEITYKNPVDKIAGAHSSINPIDDPINVLRDTATKGAKVLKEGAGDSSRSKITDKIQKLKNKVDKLTTTAGHNLIAIGDRVEGDISKVPVVGEVFSAIRHETPSVGEKIAEIGDTPIVVSIDPYLNKDATNVATHSFDTPSVTFGQIADWIAINVLKEKPEKTAHLLPEGDKGSSIGYSSRRGLDPSRFSTTTKHKQARQKGRSNGKSPNFGP